MLIIIQYCRLSPLIYASAPFSREKQDTNVTKLLFVFHQILMDFYLRQGERSQRWRRLGDWSFCPSFCVCVCEYMMTPHVIHKQTSGPARRPDVCTPY